MAFLFCREFQKDLAKIQAESEIMLYPTDFNEMFCISALECLATSTPIITSKRAALIERVEDGRNGFLIEGKPGTDNFNTEFVNKAVSFLKSEKLKKNFLNPLLLPFLVLILKV